MYINPLLVTTGILASMVMPVYTITPQELIRAPLLRNEHAMTLLRRSVNESKFRKREQLINANGREYLIQVSVGTPPQLFNMTLDTGSAEIWVPTTKCPKKVCPYERFDPNKSSTLTVLNEVFSIQYGLGNAEGVYGQDTVSIGTTSVSNQKIGLVNNTKDILGVVSDGTQSNGIFGLGYPGLNSARGVKNDIPFAFHLMQQQLSFFSIYLTNSHQTKSSSSSGGGEIIFGGVDKTKFSGELIYVPVIDYDIQHQHVSPNVGKKNGTRQGGTYLYWTVPGQGVSTSKNYTHTTNDVVPFVLDTGTTMTYMPASVVKGIVQSISTKKKPVFDVFNSIYQVDCSLRNNKRDSVHFQLSTSKTEKQQQPLDISVPVSELIIPLDTNDLATATSCMFAIAPAQPSDSLSSAPTWLLGEATLRAVYTVYDMAQNRVGLAPYSPHDNTTSSSSSAENNIQNPNNQQQQQQQQQQQSSASSIGRSSVITLGFIVLVLTL
ncbi:aspartic peptidase domain-containing protein [Halteromyces radiatus]|uniref:aspartic peptidase domain-containing protein n=1 Tax=Halteromyces radiatus TaxID=101107 RepID=UPI00221E5564|nr:aspartic peptidase domain-containing protein [Halteromyces radiatus]KAI8084529.1 aspartic peptidase domain-containing protein [Halteromyces radiatus]